MNNSSYQAELDNFYKALFHHEVAKRVIYKGNLSKARAKLKYDAFVDLNDHMIDFFYRNFDFHRAETALIRVFIPPFPCPGVTTLNVKRI
nr:hypothetical protein [uncultured Desulfobacter sp.]